LEIDGIRGAGCRWGVIEPVQPAPQRAGPARHARGRARRPGRSREAAGGAWRVSDETIARAGLDGEPLSAITAGRVSLVAMLVLGQVIGPR
jgi:hypothetical protein